MSQATVETRSLKRPGILTAAAVLVLIGAAIHILYVILVPFVVSDYRDRMIAEGGTFTATEESGIVALVMTLYAVIALLYLLSGIGLLAGRNG